MPLCLPVCLFYTPSVCILLIPLLRSPPLPQPERQTDLHVGERRRILCPKYPIQFVCTATSTQRNKPRTDIPAFQLSTPKQSCTQPSAQRRSFSHATPIYMRNIKGNRYWRSDAPSIMHLQTYFVEGVHMLWKDNIWNEAPFPLQGIMSQRRREQFEINLVNNRPSGSLPREL